MRATCTVKGSGKEIRAYAANERKGVSTMKKVEKFLEGLYESYLHR